MRVYEFVAEEKRAAMQAADMLVWQHANQTKRQLENVSHTRTDFRALAAKPHHELAIVNRQAVGGLVAFQRRLKGLPMSGISGRFGAMWFWCPLDGGIGVCHSLDTVHGADAL